VSAGTRDWTAAAANVAAVLAVLLAVLVFLSGRFDRIDARFDAMDARIDARLKVPNPLTSTRPGLSTRGFVAQAAAGA